MSDTENSGGEQEDLKSFVGPKGVVKRWLKEIELVKNSKEQKAFESIGEKIVKTYRSADSLIDAESTSKVMFNVLWANVQVLKPSLYSRMPKVVVERRFKDSDPVGRLAAQICERATSFMLDSQQDRFNFAIKAAVEDRLLVGRGQVWVRYDAEFEELKDENGEPILDDAGNAVKSPKPNSEKVVIDPLFWQDYHHSTARNPFEIRWHKRDVYLTRSQLISKFGKLGEEVELLSDKEKKDGLNADQEMFLKQAVVYEIWDEESKKAFWISEGYKDAPLKELADPLKLKDFFPCPIPLLATTTTDSMYPTPDYKIYQKLAEELDYVTKRISSIVECIRVVGACAASVAEDLKKVRDLDDGGLAPVVNWAQFMNEKGGIAGAISWFPFDQAVSSLQPLVGYQQTLLTQVRSISRIPDVMMGESDPTDPVYTQQMKGKALVLNMREPQADVQRFCREVVSKVAEIIFEPGLFADETIGLMCGVSQLSPADQMNYPASLQLLRDDRMRTFRVGIETDSTIAIDEDAEKAARMEYVGALNQLTMNLQQVSQFRPELLHPMIETALFAARAFRTGRPVEGAWEKALEMIEANDKAAQENPEPPPPDPAMMKAENERAKIQQDGQLKNMELQFNQWEKSQRLQLDGMKARGELALEHEANMVAAGQQTSKTQIDMIFAGIDKFAQDFKARAESERLRLDKMRLDFDRASRALELKEKFIEEQRLAKDQQLEHMRIMSDHVNTVKQLEHDRKVDLKAQKEEKAASKESSKAQPPVNIHLNTDQPLTLKEGPKAKKRKHKIKKSADGSYDVDSEDVDEVTT